MTIRLSTGLRNAMAQGLGLAGVLNRGSINIYSGPQPVSADAAATGTLLGTITAASAALTQETRATGSITVTGVAGSIDSVTVGGFNIIPDGVVPFNASAAQTAADLAEAINRNGIFTASVAGAVVTISPRPGAGAAYNAAVVASTGACTCTYVNVSGGAAPANGLILTNSGAGVIAKPSTQIWSMNGIAAGTAGWFRFIASAVDAGAALAAAPWLARLDGSVAVAGADMNLSNITVAVGAPVTIDTFGLTIPAQ